MQAQDRIKISNLKNTVKHQKSLSEKRVIKAKTSQLKPPIEAQDRALTLEQKLDAYEQSQRDILKEIDSLKRTLENLNQHIAHIAKESTKANQQLTEDIHKVLKQYNAAKDQITQLQDKLKSQGEDLDNVTHIKSSLKV